MPEALATILVRARCSNGDQYPLRLLRADAAELYFQLGRELGWLPPLEDTGPELPDEGEED